MSEFRPGDKSVEIKGEIYRLRLTVSALAKLADVFQAEDPKALAARLRKATLADWNMILRTVATPQPSVLQRAEMLAVIPELSALMTEGLRA